MHNNSQIAAKKIYKIPKKGLIYITKRLRVVTKRLNCDKIMRTIKVYNYVII